MMFEYTYLLNQFHPDFFIEKSQQAATFIIPIDEALLQDQPSIFQILLRTPNRFCFSLPQALTGYDKGFIREEIIQNIIRLLFLPNYIKSNGMHVLFIEQAAEEQQAFVSIRETFNYILTKQGVKPLFLDMIDAGAESGAGAMLHDFAIKHSLLNNYLGGDGNEIASDIPGDFASSFTIPGEFDKKWIVPVTDFCDFTRKTRKLDYFEQWLRIKEPLKVALIERHNTVKSELGKLLSENELLKFKLDNSANYLQLIRKESQGLIHEIGSLRMEVSRLTQQIINGPGAHLSNSLDDPDLLVRMQAQIHAEHKRADDTLNWYIKEYEVLPMWYKRFGQILKVFMGKRTFKSLFDK